MAEFADYNSQGKIRLMTEAADATTVVLLKMLAERLERLSADSLWARRASGSRRSLLKSLEVLDAGGTIPGEQADRLIENAIALLTRAAQEIPDIPPRFSSSLPKEPPQKTP